MRPHSGRRAQTSLRTGRTSAQRASPARGARARRL